MKTVGACELKAQTVASILYAESSAVLTWLLGEHEQDEVIR
jgi:hypothetical protein